MECLACSGELSLLGVLGNRAHLRCIQCGTDQSVEGDITAPEDPEDGDIQ